MRNLGSCEGKIGWILFIQISLATLSFIGVAKAQIPNGTLFGRVSRVSNFEFSVYNSGMIWGDYFWPAGGSNFAPPIAYWPRGTFHLYPDPPGNGIVFLAQKGGRLLASDAGFIKPINMAHGPFNQTVPGWIGDPRSGYDSLFNGVGWRYVDDRDYIVYSSLDYDEKGVDVSGSNFNDWPIRLVNGAESFVRNPMERSLYSPVYRSDEDMFCVFKDTDTRADQLFMGAEGPSIPIGLEFHCYIYSWGSGPAKDIVLFQYDVTNKSGEPLDSCYVIFGSDLDLSGPNFQRMNRTIQVYSEEPWRNMTYVRPTNSSEWQANWAATAVPPTMGFPLVETPLGYDGNHVGLKSGVCTVELVFYEESPGGSVSWVGNTGNDSIYYRIMSSPRVFDSEDLRGYCDSLSGAVAVSGPFPMSIDQTARYAIACIFSDSLEHLLLLDDFITRVYNNNFQRPSPPPTPKLTATGLNRSIKLSWDASAETAADIIIPDSLGRAFVGYSLQRAENQEGPYTEIGRWHTDTLLVHEYLDKGDSSSAGLKNNVTYFYRLLSFDEGAVRLKLDPMDSPAIDGVNQIAVIPTTEPANATSEESMGALQAGILGDVTVPTLIPTNTTNFNRLLSGRTISVKLDAVSNGVGYTIPVTITDSVAGREHNAIIDPDLLIHGNTDIAGPRTSEAMITDVFAIGAANITLSYSFEQLAEPFHIEPTIVGGADVPIILSDSLSITGLQLSDPYKSANINLILAFSPGGIDTGSTIFQRFFPYLKVRLINAATNTDYTGEWTLSARGVRRTGGASITWSKTDRYYLSGMISNGEEWDQGHVLTVYNWAIAFDFADHGIGSGKPSPTFIWASPHVSGTIDFQAGDSVKLSWEGGVRAVFPQGAVISLTGAPAGRTAVTQEMMEGIRIVPNPYFIRHEAQRGDPRIYFNYLPEECTIRIYTVALDLVKTITHTDGSREEWDLTTEGGQLVASQLLIAHIEATNGAKTVKKFAVVVGR